MTREFFLEQLKRLTEAGVKAPSPAQAEAVWETVVRANHLSGPEWVHVVNLALSGGRWPAPEAWQRYAEKAKAVVRAVATVQARRCDCGRGTFERIGAQWIYMGPGKFVFTAGDPGGAVHRMEHPELWAAAVKYGCQACYGEAWLMLDEGRSANTGRSFKPGDFILRTRGEREPPPQRDIPIYHNEDYQLARRRLLTRIAREKLNKAQIADILFDLGDAFPEKANHLKQEAIVFREEYEKEQKELILRKKDRSEPPTPLAPGAPGGGPHPLA